MPTHERFARCLLPTILLGLMLAVPAGAEVGHHGPTGDGGPSNIRIVNFGRVSGTYYRGAQPEGHDYQDLAAAGVKSVINLTSDDADANEKSMVEGAGMKYFQIPMTTHQPPTAAQLSAFLKIVNDPDRQPVYVHCVGGRHRTGVMTAVYRMADDGWTADRAFAEMKQYKYGAGSLHPEFKEFLHVYHPDIASPAEAARVAESRN
jgi:protein tyrosine/serine phosphatase